MSENRQIGSDLLSEQVVVPTGTAYLLAIGIDAYSSCPPLHNAVRDVESFVKILTSRYQFEVDNITLLLNGNATRSKIHSALRHLTQTITSEDALLIYYAGHGSYDRVMDKGYWVPVDGILNDPSSYYSSDEIIGAVRMIKSRHTLIISDSCFSGKLFTTRDLVFDEYQEATPSRWMMTSGRNEVVPDDGPFSSSLTNFLTRNTEQVVRCARLFEAITIPVVSNSWQRPRYEPLYGVHHEGGEFAFRLKTKRDEQDSPKNKPTQKDQTAKTDSADTTRHPDASSTTDNGGLQRLIRQLGGPAMATALLLIALLIIGVGAWSLIGGSNDGIKAGGSLATDQKSDTVAGQKPLAQVQQQETPSSTGSTGPSVKPDNTQPKPGNPKKTSQSPVLQNTKIDKSDNNTTTDPEPPTLPVINNCPVNINTGGKSGLRVYFSIGGANYDATSSGQVKLTFQIPCTFKDASPKMTFEYNGKTATLNPKLSSAISAPNSLFE